MKTDLLSRFSLIDDIRRTLFADVLFGGTLGLQPLVSTAAHDIATLLSFDILLAATAKLECPFLPRTRLLRQFKVPGNFSQDHLVSHSVVQGEVGNLPCRYIGNTRDNVFIQERKSDLASVVAYDAVISAQITPPQPGHIGLKLCIQRFLTTPCKHSAVPSLVPGELLISTKAAEKNSRWGLIYIFLVQCGLAVSGIEASQMPSASRCKPERCRDGLVHRGACRGLERSDMGPMQVNLLRSHVYGHELPVTKREASSKLRQTDECGLSIWARKLGGQSKRHVDQVNRAERGQQKARKAGDYHRVDTAGKEHSYLSQLWLRLSVVA
mmetsp:Transcript_11209/g.34315  ORF Transcript_11209/g.34315 Transcript_11209/m.34315 type:complete len:325 (-) Transcript_11209:906-1880(-)